MARLAVKDFRVGRAELTVLGLFALVLLLWIAALRWDANHGGGLVRFVKDLLSLTPWG